MCNHISNGYIVLVIILIKISGGRPSFFLMWTNKKKETGEREKNNNNNTACGYARAEKTWRLTCISKQSLFLVSMPIVIDLGLYYYMSMY